MKGLNNNDWNKDLNPKQKENENVEGTNVYARFSYAAGVAFKSQ
jgi:hypothetical protein